MVAMMAVTRVRQKVVMMAEMLVVMTVLNTT
jgi:hypothetical protein